MGENGGFQSIVDTLYALYKENGYLREDEALELMTAAEVSLEGVNRIKDRLIDMGVIFLDNSPDDTEYDDFDYDRSQRDYEKIFSEVLEIAPGEQMLIDYVRRVRPPQLREWQQLIPQARSGNINAFNRLFDMYLRVLIKIALQTSKRKDYELDDAIQEGAWGLIYAINKFDAGKHGNLGSYFPLWIQESVDRAIADKSRTIRIPVYTYEMLPRITDSIEKLLNRFGREPSYEEIAVEAKASVGAVKRLLETIQETVSVEMLLEDESNEEILFKYFSVPSFEEEINVKFAAAKLRECLRTLTDREREVLSLRYGLDDGRERSLAEVGVSLNVTRERVRQIEERALDKLRHPTRAQFLKDSY